jgi:multiple sugar transport system ATP-binding protein
MDEPRAVGVSVRNLSKSYGKVQALRNVSLEVPPGSFTTLLGPSGCGKTTLLRCIAGLEEPESGEIWIGDKMVFGRKGAVCVPPKARDLGLVFQSYALWPHMTVKENIAFGLRIKKYSSQAVDSRVDEVLETVGLTGYESRYPSELSGGQQQRVSLARMLAVKPSILLMDEPLSNLDAKLRNNLRIELKRLHSTTGNTVVYVTHDQIEAMSLSTDVAVMNEGTIQDLGSPGKVYHDPANIFVADFMGNPYMNLVESETVLVDSRIEACAVGGDLRVPIVKDSVGAGQKVTIGFRPEEVSVCTSEGCGKARVHAVLSTGADLLVTLRSGDVLVTARVDNMSSFDMDQSVYFSVDPRVVNVFDTESGRSVGIASEG